MFIDKLNNKFAAFFLFALFLFLSGCAQKTTVVLLPDPDGKVGHITVSTNAGSTDITQAREATVIKDRESLPTSPEILSEDKIDADFSPVLAILPNQPVHFILYFKSESTKLRVNSKKVLPQILESIHNRDSKDISVIGHSDTAGDPQYNLQLSQRRASAINRILVKKGVDSTHIKTTSHGEENLLIKTADNVHEPKNRRVEVVVR